MNYLLDTVALLHILKSEESCFSKQVQALFENTKNQFFVSTVSIWEIAIKYSLKKLQLNKDPHLWLMDSITQMGLKDLPIQADHALAIINLPQYHNDPFDRLLIAQAMIEKLPIISPDMAFKKYKIKIVW